MDAATLNRIVPNASLARCAELIDGYNWCARTIGATTVNRCAMLIAQVAEESASLQATQEYASGWEYEGRAALGNTQSGDGPRFKGRTLIQITGRNNYGATSRWAHARGIVPTDTYFVDNPAALAELRYAWVGPAQYWLASHGHGYGHINAAADAGDIQAATEMVNGGLNGFDTRNMYWHRALAQGAALLPTASAPTGDEAEEMALSAQAQAQVAQIVAAQFSRFFATAGSDGKLHDHSALTLMNQSTAAHAAVQAQQTAAACLTRVAQLQAANAALSKKLDALTTGGTK